MTQKWLVLAAVACGTFMATLDSSIVNIALPTLTKELGPDLYRAKWVVIVYLLVITCLLLPFGRVSDQYGRKRVFQAGFLTFVLGSALCGFSPQLNWLVLFRALQGVGAAMLMANGPAIITSTFSTRDRGAALGTLAMVVSVGLVTGPSLGGFLLTYLGWRSIFWVNIPIGFLGIALAHRYVKKDGHSGKVSLPFDWAGALIQSILLILFIILFDPPQVSVSGSLPIEVSRWMIAIAVIALSLIFIKVESDAKAPLFDLTLLKNRTFWTTNLAGFLTFVAFSSVTVLMPFFLEEVMHFPPQKAGFFMTAIPLTIFVVAPISGRLSDKLGSQELSIAGALVGVIGLFVMSGVVGLGIQEDTPSLGIVMGLCSIGLALGLFQAPNNNAIMGCVPLHKLGVASALLATVRNLGMVTGTGLSTTLFSWRLSSTGNFIAAFHTALFTASLIGIGAMFASLGKRPLPNEKND
jgi:EmrB/QacA subfamily drug resistance transporter